MHKNIQDANYIYIKNFISPDRANELAKSFIEFAKENDLQGDPQVAESHSKYNYVDFLELLCEKTPEVSQFLGETVLPTYTYARVYKKGSVLERHRDREACEVSLTLNLSKDKEWPIWIQKPDGEEVSLNLKSGDAMMYLGNVADHWREEFQGNEYVQVFLHYVRSRGENAWAVFDKEKVRPANFKAETKQPQLIAAPTGGEVAQPPFIISAPHAELLSNYICEFENVIPEDLCDDILAEYANSNEWMDTIVGRGEVQKSIRNVEEICISFDHVIQKNKDVRFDLDQRIFQAAGRAISLYNSKFPEANVQEDSGYELLRYRPGQFYRQHTDSFKQQPRAISCSFSLNDDYEGGEFAFFDGRLKYKAKKGSVLMFPSNFMFPHEIMKVTSGTRYSIITWFV